MCCQTSPTQNTAYLVSESLELKRMNPEAAAGTVNEPIRHPQPRHLRLATDTLAAAGDLTAEASHALRLAGAYYRATPQYDAWQRLQHEREQHDEARKAAAKHKAEQDAAIVGLKKKVRELRQELGR